MVSPLLISCISSPRGSLSLGGGATLGLVCSLLRQLNIHGVVKPRLSSMFSLRTMPFISILIHLSILRLLLLLLNLLLLYWNEASFVIPGSEWRAPEKKSFYVYGGLQFADSISIGVVGHLLIIKKFVRSSKSSLSGLKFHDQRIDKVGANLNNHTRKREA